jgi:hypothetical protein
VQTAQAGDNHLSCPAIQAEMASNNTKITELGREKGQKTAQNVAAGVAGLFIWPLWFLMDFQGAAATETVALQNRNVHLASLADDQCRKVAQATSN